ncbi:MAG TPA: hypothetical protein PKM27_14355 [Saprospiraceae bacterium]|nr:hypothetical protein [Saprospiraceae bacterium]HNT22137.1 hypothetical protein [Saprospiraceae bacterium]
MNIEKIAGILFIIYGIYIAYETSKYHYPFNKETYYVYQFKDYFAALMAFILGLLLIFSNITFNELFD